MDMMLGGQLLFAWVVLTAVLVGWLSWLNPGPKRGEDAVVLALIGGLSATLAVFLYVVLWVVLLMTAGGIGLS